MYIMYVCTCTIYIIFNFCVILTLHILTLSIIYSSLLCSPATGRGSPRCPRLCPCWAGHSAARGSCWSPRRRPPRPRTARCSTAPGSGTARTDTPVISGIMPSNNHIPLVTWGQGPDHWPHSDQPQPRVALLASAVVIMDLAIAIFRSTDLGRHYLYMKSYVNSM